MENKNKQHVQVPDAEQTNLRPTDKLVYANIRRHMNKDTMCAFPSITTIAKEAGVTKPTVQSCIKRLIKAGYIEVLEEKHNNRNNIYKFTKLDNDFERFTNEFLDNPNLNSGEKAYLIGLQSQCFKHGQYALTSYTNKELAEHMNISTDSVTRYNTSLKTKEIMEELRSVQFDEFGFKKIVKAIDMQKIGQQVLFEVAVNHEDRIQNLEKVVALLLAENRELKKDKIVIYPTEYAFSTN